MLNQGNQTVGQITKLYNVRFSILGFKSFFQMIECFICTSVQISKLIAKALVVGSVGEQGIKF